MTRLFGTNGIRGIVNEEMNGPLALGIGKAWGTLFKRTLPRPTIAIGTDTRLSNTMLRSAVSSGLLSTGCDVVDVGIVPTPTLQYTVKKKHYDSGVIITASHNPPQFNGIKGVAGDGTEFSRDTEEAIETIYFNRDYSLANWQDVGTCSSWDGAIDFHLKGILSLVDISRIRKQRFQVVLDCGNGAGCFLIPLLLEKLGCQVKKLFCEPDGTFPGRSSEPTPQNLADLIETVKKDDVVFGVAHDGDADRAIFIDETGEYILGDRSLSLVGRYIAQKKKHGVFVTPVTTSTCFKDVIQENGGDVVYTRVGSPTVARVMIEKNAVFGGEENGGLIFPDLQYCRDAAMSVAMMLEILTHEKRKLSELVDEIPWYENVKHKINCPNNQKEIVLKTLVEQVKESEDVVEVDTTDGVKLYLEEGWVLLRPSGTEPIFRIYVESNTKSSTERLAKTYQKIVEEIIEKNHD